MRIEIGAKNGVLAGKLDGRVLDKLRELPGRSRWKERELHFEASGANIAYLRQAFPDAEFVDEAGRMAALDELRQLEADSVAVKNARTLPYEASAFPFKTQPRDHQRRAFVWARDRKFFGFFMEMGTGKTKTTIDVAAYKYATGEIDAVLLIAPNGVHSQWHEREVPKHMPDFVQLVQHCHRAGKKPPPAIFEPTSKLRILYINVEALSHASGVELATRFMLSCRAVFVPVDESTTIKATGSARGKAVRKLGRMAECRAILSGAPITRSVEDMYGQMKFLSDDIFGFSSEYTFKNRYCDMVPAYRGAPRGVTKVVGTKNMEEFIAKVDAHSFRVRKDECLDLPPKVYLEREIEFTSEQKRIYKEIARDCCTELRGNFIDVGSAVAKIMRLQQILGGHLPDEDGNVHLVPTNRLGDLAQWCEQVAGKGIIWARFTFDIQQICEMLRAKGYTFARYDGPSKATRADEEAEFLDGSGRQFMVANQQAAARGKNWQVANDTGFYSNSFDADHRWQAEDRSHRDGLVGTATITDWFVPGTIDRVIWRSLTGKKNVADSVLDDKEMWREALGSV